MNRIPIGATLDDAYRFFFRNFLAIVGTAWFPALVFATLVGAFLIALVPHGWQLPQTVEPEGFADFLRPRLHLLFLSMPVIAISGLLAGAMIKVGILERALGLRTGRTLFYFSLGAPVWRMAAVSLVNFLVLLVLMVIEIIAAVALHHAVAAQVSSGWVILFNIVQVIGWIALFVYCNVRLFFFLPAVVVAEQRLGLARSWSLGGGNVGRAIVVFLAVVLPVGFVTSMIGNGLMMPVLGDHLLQINGQPDPAVLGRFFAALLPLIPVMVGVHLVGALVVTGTLMGGIARAYKAVAGAE